MAKKSTPGSKSSSGTGGVDLHEVERLLEFMAKHGLEEFEYERSGFRIRLRKPFSQPMGVSLAAAGPDIVWVGPGPVSSCCERKCAGPSGRFGRIGTPRCGGRSRRKVTHCGNVLRRADCGWRAFRDGRLSRGGWASVGHYRSNEADERNRIGRGGRSGEDLCRKRAASGVWRIALRHSPAPEEIGALTPGEMFRKILIANRGEIALRILSACRELGIRTVAVYSEADRHALHVRFADEAICIGPPRSSESYLNIPQVISAAEIANVDAIHPGYGFLSENANFAEVCEASHITFIGPTPDAIRLMGEKDKAKEAMAAAGIPVIPGSAGVVPDEDSAKGIAHEIGYPVMIKAAEGGGGRGMRVVHSAKELIPLFRTARTEAEQAVGSPNGYVEEVVERAPHIEFQVLGDKHGNVIHLGERECSLQRRHQKVLEESPSVAVDAGTRQRVGK